MSPLDNPAWFALQGEQGQFGRVGEHAARYRADISPIAAVRDASPEAFAELASLFEPGEFCAVVADHVPTDERWRNAARVELTQWVCPTPIVADETALGFVELSGDRRDEMHALAKATDPGPFELQTHVLGDYIGIDQSGRLVAMAGERLCFESHREVSAVCTDAAHVGHGYAQALVREIGRRQQAKGCEPFLHVRVGSPAEQQAIRVYEKLGFVKRVDTAMVVLVRQ